MMCVALLKNPVGETTGRGVARLGQLVLLVELIGNVQDARRAKEAAANVWLLLSSFQFSICVFTIIFQTLDATFMDVIRFVTALEKRLSILIEEKARPATVLSVLLNLTYPSRKKQPFSPHPNEHCFVSSSVKSDY